MQFILLIVIILCVVAACCLAGLALWRTKGMKPDLGSELPLHMFVELAGCAPDAPSLAANTTESGEPSIRAGNRRHDSLLVLGLNASFQALVDRAHQFMLSVHPDRVDRMQLLPHERALMRHALDTAQLGNQNTLAWADALNPEKEG